MSNPSFKLHPALPRVLLALALLLLLGGGGAWGWLVARPVDADHPDTVGPEDLAAALTPDTSLPLSIEHTDVLVVAACTLRRDRMGLYGHTFPTTPFLDALGERGVVFDEHFSQAPWTRPAMGAIFTGRWPRILKLDNPAAGKGFTAILHDDHHLLAEVLSSHGYTAVGAVANPNLKARFGFAQGFSAYTEPDGTYKERPHIPGAEEIVDDALRLAEAVPTDERLYLRVNVLDTHLPQKYKLHYPKLMGDQPARLVHYDAALRTVDAELARLFTELRKTRPNLLVIFAADHGEGLYLPRHHGPEHGNYVYRTTTQTPWIVYHPGLEAPGRRIEGRSMNIDIVPTIASLLGISLPGPVDGVSQSGAITGQTHLAAHTFAYSETFFRKRHLSMVFDGSHQLIREYDRPTVTGPFADSLYAEADWAANTDIAEASPDITNRLAGVLSEWEATILEQARDAPQVRNDDVDESTNQMLRDLGYVDD